MSSDFDGAVDAKTMNLKHYRWSTLFQLAVLLWALPLQAQKFYPDDPLTQEPASVSS